MKAYNKLAAIALGVASLAMAGCSDFDEVNTSPSAIDALHTQPYYLLAQGIQNIQQNPDTAERTFVINWLMISRIADVGYSTAVGGYNDGYISTAYGIASNSIKNAARAIEVANIHLESGKRGERDTKFIKNTIAYARIWRVYAMSEFADQFGPMPLNVAQGVNPTFSPLKDVYYYFMDELRAAVADIDTTIEATADEAASDHAYGWNPVKWKNYGISMWMRLAMRMSEVDPAKAKQEFEDAVKAGDGIRTEDGVFQMPENTGWDDFTAVMSRTWNEMTANVTMTNLMTNFGSSAQTGLNAAASYYETMDYNRYKEYVKDASQYMGVDCSEFVETNSDNPIAGMFFDGIPSKIDPRAFVYYTLPHDGPDRKLHYFSYFKNPRCLLDDEYMMENNGGDKKIIEATKICKKYAFNGLPNGWTADDKAKTLNGLYAGTPERKYMDNGEEKTGSTWGTVGSWPMISDHFRAAENKGRVFFGPWETYFLLAEAAELGWNVGTNAKAAYEAGIKASFDYYDISDAYSEYIASTDYNRVGTSVAFDHVAEPVNFQIKYVDVRDQSTVKTKTYEYPNKANLLYKGGKLNDHRTKILTQKYIANAPWLPLECWSDWRRTGLPFFERACGTAGNITYLNWSSEQYKSKAEPDQFVQRMRYPNSLKNADPEEFQHALELLGDPENTGKTSLWWAIGYKGAK